MPAEGNGEYYDILSLQTTFSFVNEVVFCCSYDTNILGVVAMQKELQLSDILVTVVISILFGVVYK